MNWRGPHEALRFFIDRCGCCRRPDAQGRRQLHAAAQRARELQQDEQAVASAAAATDVVLAVLGGYGLEGDDAVHAARTVRVAMHGFVSLEAEGGFAIDLSLDESFERLIATLDRGLRSPE